jgi:hypothetical protein
LTSFAVGINMGFSRMPLRFTYGFLDANWPVPFEMNHLTRNLSGLVERHRIKKAVFDRRLEMVSNWHQNLSEGQDMDSITPRERFKAVPDFGKSDRLPLYW